MAKTGGTDAAGGGGGGVTCRESMRNVLADVRSLSSAEQFALPPSLTSKWRGCPPDSINFKERA